MEKRIVKAKIRLMLENLFWGSLVVRLELRDWDGNTFATNGKYILCPSEKYSKQYTDEEIYGVIAHETFHCAMLHPFRMKGRNHSKWNIAADYAADNSLVKNGFAVTIGGKDCLPNREQYAGMSSEKIYAMLPENPPNNGGGGKGEGSGKGEKGGKNEEQGRGQILDLIDPETGKSSKDGKQVVPAGEGSLQELEADWKEAVSNALQNAKAQGKLPSEFEEFIEANLFPKVPWETKLYKFLQAAKGNSDFTAYPFDRRHIWRGIYLPSMRGESIEIICGVDTSGSIDKEDLVRYFSELRGICSIFGSYTIHLFECDAATHSQFENYIITEESDVPNVVVGRGGTDFRPVFEAAEKHELYDMPMVFFTDLDGSFPNDERENVFWVIRKTQNRGNHEVPFGEIIEIDD